MYRARAAFGAMEEIVFGRPAAEAVVGQIDRWRARTFPIVRGTLNRETSEIKSEIRKMATSIPRDPRKIDGPAQIREILLLAA